MLVLMLILITKVGFSSQLANKNRANESLQSGRFNHTLLVYD